jgi:hypothetical protein
VQYTAFSTDSITVADSASNSGWSPAVDTLVDAGTGQGLASFYNLSLGTGLSSGSITATDSSGADLQSIAVISFTNSVAGTPTLDGHHGLDNTTSATTANSGAGNSTSGDLVLTGFVGVGPGSSFTPTLAITGVASTTVRNNASAAAGYVDGSGVTTTGGAASVTSNWSGLTAAAHVVLELIFAPPTAGPTAVFSDSGAAFEHLLTSRSANERQQTVWWS